MSQVVGPWMRERLVPRGLELAVGTHPHGGSALAEPPPASAGRSHRPKYGSEGTWSVGGGLVQAFRFLTFANKGDPEQAEPMWLIASDPLSRAIVCLSGDAVAKFHRYRRERGLPIRTVSSLRGGVLVLSQVTVTLGQPPAATKRFLNFNSTMPFPAHLVAPDMDELPPESERRTLILHCDRFKYLGSEGEEPFWDTPAWLWSITQENEVGRLVRERLSAIQAQQSHALAAQQQGTMVTTMSFTASASASGTGLLSTDLPASATTRAKPSQNTRRRRPHRGHRRRGRKSATSQQRSERSRQPSHAGQPYSLNGYGSVQPPAVPADPPIFNPLAFPIALRSSSPLSDDEEQPISGGGQVRPTSSNVPAPPPASSENRGVHPQVVTEANQRDAEQKRTDTTTGVEAVPVEASATRQVPPPSKYQSPDQLAAPTDSQPPHSSNGSSLSFWSSEPARADQVLAYESSSSAQVHSFHSSQYSSDPMRSNPPLLLSQSGAQSNSQPAPGAHGARDDHAMPPPGQLSLSMPPPGQQPMVTANFSTHPSATTQTTRSQDRDETTSRTGVWQDTSAESLAHILSLRSATMGTSTQHHDNLSFREAVPLSQPASHPSASLTLPPPGQEGGTAPPGPTANSNEHTTHPATSATVAPSTDGIREEPRGEQEHHHRNVAGSQPLDPATPSGSTDGLDDRLVPSSISRERDSGQRPVHLSQQSQPLNNDSQRGAEQPSQNSALQSESPPSPTPSLPSSFQFNSPAPLSQGPVQQPTDDHAPEGDRRGDATDAAPSRMSNVQNNRDDGASFKSRTLSSPLTPLPSSLESVRSDPSAPAPPEAPLQPQHPPSDAQPRRLALQIELSQSSKLGKRPHSCHPPIAPPAKRPARAPPSEPRIAPVEARDAIRASTSSSKEKGKARESDPLQGDVAASVNRSATEPSRPISRTRSATFSEPLTHATDEQASTAQTAPKTTDKSRLPAEAAARMQRLAKLRSSSDPKVQRRLRSIDECRKQLNNVPL